MRDYEVQKGHPYSLNDLMLLTVQHLYDVYVVAVKHIPGDEFIEDVLKPLPRLDRRETDQPLEILLQCATDQEKAKDYDASARSPVSPILLSATYYFRAMHARDTSHPDAAWSYLVEAWYWCGVAMAGKGLQVALQQAADGVKRDMAASGAKKRSERFQPLRDLACDLARNSAPPSGCSSRNHAVQVVNPKVLELADSAGIKVSLKQIERTIDDWLKALPDAAQLFSKRK
ncbi:hypothetical protein KDH83_07510 [Achromobacter sp. Marseille-Q0513]|uniref:hypothetical protein n=1 Tax=Achromobacter sp. Marseille-Q0513 TaxID=2829161 RepID=UPI001B9FF854|nr:hypothetical protein [Achromobacter sp. Marseille-Q0513]MBR8653160.1 hypothetical protein [Achromobacter sp. Marseille-Q0513]